MWRALARISRGYKQMREADIEIMLIQESLGEWEGERDRDRERERKEKESEREEREAEKDGAERQRRRWIESARENE